MVVRARLWFIAGGVATLALLMAYPAQAAFPGAKREAGGQQRRRSALHQPGRHQGRHAGGEHRRALGLVPGRKEDRLRPGRRRSGARHLRDELRRLRTDGAHKQSRSRREPGVVPRRHEEIVFESARDGNSELYVMNADGSAVQRLTSDAAVDRDPAWSPDGTKVAFASDRQSYTCEDPEDPSCYVRPTFRIFTMAPDGSGVALRVSTAEPFDCFDGVDVFTAPDWSSDGASIVYESIELDRCLDGYQHGVRTDGPGGRSLYFETKTRAAL